LVTYSAETALQKKLLKEIWKDLSDEKTTKKI